MLAPFRILSMLALALALARPTSAAGLGLGPVSSLQAAPAALQDPEEADELAPPETAAEEEDEGVPAALEESGEAAEPAPPAAPAPEEGLPPEPSAAEPAAPTRREPRPPQCTLSTPTPVVLDGWEFQCVALGTVTLYYQASIAQGNVDRGREAVQFATDRVLEVMGRPPTGNVDVYLMAGRLQLFRVVSEYAGAPPTAIAPQAVGLSVGAVVNPGIYVDATGLGTDSLAVHLIAHEYTHEVQRRLEQGRFVPVWFIEGMAEAVAGIVLRERFPADYERDSFSGSAEVVNAARMGGLRSFGSLVDSIQWRSANVLGPLAYYQTWLAVERLSVAHGAGSYRRALELIGQGESFDSAFESVYGQSVEAFEAEFLAYLAGPLGERFPPGLVVNRQPVRVGEVVQYAYLGLRPGETVTLQFQGPGTCKATGFLLGNSLGYVGSGFRVQSAGCAGEWTATATGNQGAQASMSFVVAPAVGPTPTRAPTPTRPAIATRTPTPTPSG